MLNALSKFRRKWLRLAEVLGTIQMVILLTIIYWTIVLVMAVPFKLLADPLTLKSTGSPRWISRPAVSDVLKWMGKQG